jgi:hypothetical protein
MKNLSLLVAGSDRQLSNAIEVVVRDVCYDHAVVECFRTARLDECVFRACAEEFDLIVVAPEELFHGPGYGSAPASLEQVLGGVQAIKSRSSAPILAIRISEENEIALLEAGVENTFGKHFDREKLKSDVRRVLRLSEPAKKPSVQPPSIGEWVNRTLQKLGWAKLRPSVER